MGASRNRTIQATRGTPAPGGNRTGAALLSDNNAPQDVVDFGLFYRDRWSELRAAFSWATYLGIDPDDVVQDTMIRAREHHHRFASDVELLMWCRRVGSNLIRRQARMAYRRW